MLTPWSFGERNELREWEEDDEQWARVFLNLGNCFPFCLFEANNKRLTCTWFCGLGVVCER